MKAKVKKARRIRRALKKVFVWILVLCAAYSFFYYMRPYFPQIERYLSSFGRVRIDTTVPDSYYDLLSKYAPPGSGLILSLGLSDNDNLQKAVDRLRGAMRLGGNKIWLAHHDADNPPAYVKQLGYGDMGILISDRVKARREELNLLAHEMGHIYVWDLDKSIFGKCDEEKLDDCAGVFLGLGILMLNGLTDETRILPGEGYETRKKAFGYLKPEALGYLLARYCAEHGIPEESIRPFMNSSARKYFDIGRDYMRRKNAPPKSPVAKPTGLFWCTKCGALTSMEISGRMDKISCSTCLAPQGTAL